MIDATLNIWRSTPFTWGGADCILSVCDYIRDVTGRDPAAPWRGTYDDEIGAQAIIDGHGGVLALFRKGMALAGFDEAPAAYGRPVVCAVAGHQIAGLCLGPRVGFRTVGRGLVEMRAEVLAAWAI